MRVLLLVCLIVGSINTFAQTLHYDYPRLNGDGLYKGIEAYISPKSDLNHICQILSGGNSSTYAVRRETKKVDTVTWSTSPYYREFVKIGKNKFKQEWFLKEKFSENPKDKKKDKVISKLVCQVYGVWTTVHITDNRPVARNDLEEIVRDNSKNIVVESTQSGMTSSLSCGAHRVYTYGWGGQRYDSSERSDCAEAMKEAVNNCLFVEGEHGSSACKSNVSSCLSIPCTKNFIGRTYGWGGQIYESSKWTTCAQSKQEAVNNCMYQEGTRGSDACKDNATCVELNEY